MRDRFPVFHLLPKAFILTLIMTSLTSGAGRAQTTKIPLNVGVMKIAGLSDVYAAQKLGYFADQGLEVKIIPANNGQILLSSLQAGALDVSLAIPGTAMQARDRGGVKLVLVMQNEVAHAKAPDQGAILVRSDSQITSLKQLAGKKIAYGQISNQQWAGIHDILLRNGVDPKSMHELEIPNPQMPSALERGLVDAVAAIEPFVSMIINTKQGRVISWNFVESVPSQPDGAFWATEQWSAKNLTTIEKFNAAMHTSIMYLNAHPDVTKKMVEEFTGMQPEMVANLIPDVWTDRVVRSDWDKTMQMMVRAGLISANLTFNELVPSYAMDPSK